MPRHKRFKCHSPARAQPFHIIKRQPYGLEIAAAWHRTVSTQMPRQLTVRAKIQESFWRNAKAPPQFTFAHELINKVKHVFVGATV